METIMDLWTIAWIAWLALFGVLEGRALTNQSKGDTLSEKVWDWFSIKGKGKAWRARRFGLLAFLAWLVMHFLTGGQY